MPSVKAAVAALDRIDWSFPSAGNVHDSIHSLHWFPGNFIPQIPSALIQVLSNPGDMILDPFVGSGTTAITAISQGRRAICSDRMSACVFISNAKISTCRSFIDPHKISKIQAALTWDHYCESDQPGSNGEGSDSRLEEWYAPRTLAQLRYLWGLLEKEEGTERKLLALLFSDVLFACASASGTQTSTGKIRRHHWGWVADNVRPKHLLEHGAVQLFRSRLSSLSKLKEKASDDLPEATVLQADARMLPLAQDSIDLIVTSPPYIGMIDYTHANRLLYMWMGWPTNEERSEEIGARYKRKRKKCIIDYLSEMAHCCTEFHRVLRPGGYCAFVIGESRKFPGTAEMALEGFNNEMPIVWGPIPRRVSRRRVSERNSSEFVEHIYVLRKP